MENEFVIRFQFLSAAALRLKVAQYRVLFDGEYPKVKIFGNFLDPQDGIAFLSSGHELEPSEVEDLTVHKGQYFWAMVDDERCKLKPTQTYEGRDKPGKWPSAELRRSQ